MDIIEKNRDIIPLNALRAFEAAGRLLSFVAAAEELFVTPAAISHHIKTLEGFVGTPLFVRRHRAVDLTDAGREFLIPVAKGLQIIEVSTMGVRQASCGGPLRLRVASCLASKWLFPRLESFYCEHPKFELEITVSTQIYDFKYNEMDALIRLRKGDFTGMRVDPFLSEYVTAVCTPEFLETHGPIKDYNDLVKLPLLHDNNLQSISTYPNWYRWLEAAGVTVQGELHGHRFDSSSMVLDATLKSQGVSLARSALVTEDLANGRIVRVGDFDYPVTHDYFLIRPVSSPKRKQIQVFQSWLLNEASKTNESWSLSKMAG